jgi:hypothetical protein
MSVTRIEHRHGRSFVVETLDTGPAPVKRPKQSFVKVPLDHATTLAAKATGGQRMFVWLLLLHRSWREDTPTVPVTNAMMLKHGISPDVKARALRQLEKAGLITVEWRDRKNPIATMRR